MQGRWGWQGPAALIFAMAVFRVSSVLLMWPCGVMRHIKVLLCGAPVCREVFCEAVFFWRCIAGDRRCFVPIDREYFRKRSGCVVLVLRGAVPMYSLCTLSCGCDQFVCDTPSQCVIHHCLGQISRSQFWHSQYSWQSRSVCKSRHSKL